MIEAPGWADLPGAQDLVLTDVFAAALAAVEGMPLGDERARIVLGIEAGAEQVLLILVDGLGYHPLLDALAYASTLRSFREDIRAIHTVAPSTTAAAITAFGTGALPGTTRMVGYSVGHGGRAMNLLAFEGGPRPEQWQEAPTRFELLAARGVDSVVISPASFAGSGLTRAALRGARHRGAFSWDERCEAALHELRSGTPVVYLYWSEIDHAGHGHGVASDAWTTALEHFDEGLGRLLMRLPSGVRTVMTADHGMVDVSSSRLRDLARESALAEDVVLLAGETRALHVHARPGRAEAVRERWRDVLGDDAWVLAPDEAGALLGEGPGLDEIGDALVFMAGREGVVDSRVQPSAMIAMPGVHGSLTPEEMRIPVIRLS